MSVSSGHYLIIRTRINASNVLMKRRLCNLSVNSNLNHADSKQLVWPAVSTFALVNINESRHWHFAALQEQLFGGTLYSQKLFRCNKQVFHKHKQYP